MELAFLDHLSTSGDSPFHRASPYSKVLFAIMAVSASVLARDIPALLCVLGIVLVLVFLCGIPIARVAHLLALPALFGLAFSAGGPVIGLLRSVSAASAFVLILGTTTFASIHALLSRVMPRILSDALYMTYRSFFLLLDELSGFARVLRLKGTGSIPAVGAALGMVLVHSIDLSERTYAVLVMRGYSGGIAATGSVSRVSAWDACPALAGLLLLLVAIVL